MRVKDKKAVVTGGSKGIGKGIAEAYVKYGASVLICGRTEESLKKACLDIGNYGEIDYVIADVADRNDVRAIAERVRNKWDKLDILVNNASMLGVRSTIMEYPEDIWDEVIKINLNAQFYVIKNLLPFLLKSESASIINVSSSVGRRGKAQWGAYAASKFGLEGLTQVLADELKTTNVRVNSVNPGGTRTEMRAEAYPDEDPMTLPTPEDIVPVFLYLASDDSIGINGNEFDARDWIGKDGV